MYERFVVIKIIIVSISLLSSSFIYIFLVTNWRTLVVCPRNHPTRCASFYKFNL